MFASLRLIFSIALLLFEAYIVVVKQSLVLLKDSRASAEEKTPHRLYARLPTWIKQIFLLSATLASIYGFFFNASSSNESWSTVGELLLIAVLLLCTVFDNLSNLTRPGIQKVWMAFYGALWFVVCLDYLVVETSTKLLIFVSITIAMVMSFLNVASPSYEEQVHQPTEEFLCGIASYLTFSFLNKSLVRVAVKKESLEYEDIPPLSDIDRASTMSQQLNVIRQKNPHISLAVSLYRLIRNEWLAQGFFQAMGSICGFISPLALEEILIYVKHGGGEQYKQEGFLRVNIWLAVFMIFLGPALKAIGDGQNYNRGRHIGIRVKAALIGLIFKKSLKIDLSASKESVGKLNNLISVDVGEIQNFCSYSHYIWSTPLEIFIATMLLFLVLGHAAFAGMIVMVISLSLGLVIGKRLEGLQDKMLKNKDRRMAIMHEVLHSIRIIKFYAWEKQFNDKINFARLQELASLLMYAATNVFLYIIWEIVPALVAVIAFMTYTKLMGKALSPALGFTSITLFNLLRFPLAVFPEMINSLVKTRISMSRIKSYLETADVEGLPKVDAKEKPSVVKNPLQEGSHIQESLEIGSLRLNNVSIAWRKVKKNDDDDEKESNNEDGEEAASCGQGILETGNQCMSSMASCFKRTGDLLDPQISSRSSSPLAGSSQQSQTGRFKKLTRADQEYQLLDHSEHGVELPEKGSSSYAESKDGIDNDVESNVPPTYGVPKDDGGEPQMTVVLEGVTLYFPPKSLVVVVGATGSGKSSLLQGAILGEALILNGTRSAVGDISYSSQSAWIQNASMRDNILFGKPMDTGRYQQVLTACALDPDVKMLPAGDDTEIGEKGVNLSGGQQQRVNLARASYAQSQIVLLDDPLSAVDAHVGEHIFTKLVLGYLADRTRVLATNNLSLVLPHADYIVCMDAYLHGVMAFGTKAEVYDKLRRYVDDDASTVIRDNSDNKAFYRGVLLNLDGIATPVNVPAGTSTSTFSSPASTIHKHVHRSRSISREVSETPAIFRPSENNHTTTGLQEEDLETLDEIELVFDSNHQYADKLYTPVITSDETTALTGGNSNNASGNTSNSASSSSSSYKGITEKEAKSTGDVPLKVYLFYLNAAGGVFVTTFLILACAWIAFSWFIQNYCLGVWMDAMQRDHGSPGYDAKVASALQRYLWSVASVIVAYVFRTFFQTFCSIRAAQRIHNHLVKSVLLAPCSWFDATPIGRVINRFSQDISTVDSNVMNHLLDFFDCCLGTLSVVCIISTILPLLLLPLLPVLVFTSWVTYQYLRLSRELKRWESIKKSPVFVLLTETLNGLNTVRAFRQETRFFAECCQRIDAMNQCHLYLWLSNRWLNFRMQILGSVVAGIVGVGVVYAAGANHDSHYPSDPTGDGGSNIAAPAAGLVLLYSLNFCDYLTWLARCHAECQMDMNSVERIEEYSAIESEKYMGRVRASTSLQSAAEVQQEMQAMSVIDSSRVLSFFELVQTIWKGSVLADDPMSLAKNNNSGNSNSSLDADGIHRTSQNNDSQSQLMMTKPRRSTSTTSIWPTEGRVDFINLSMRYKTQTARPVLQNVSFSIAPREKVGVVGRTGAGKSSLIIALYRLVEPYAGQIRIDDENILDMPLLQLRSSIAIVPQEPTLFNGSLRFNLDPFQEYADRDILLALQKVQLCDVLGLTELLQQAQAQGHSFPRYDPNGTLETMLVAEKGGNYSVGQRQLLCMARAILRRTKILVLDECTASVDHETDALIQEIVRSQLADTTVLCIAHRLHTVAYYDKVLVMDRGEAKEFDAPLTLMQQDDSLFRSLCQSSGSYDQLLQIAREAGQQKKKGSPTTLSANDLQERARQSLQQSLA